MILGAVTGTLGTGGGLADGTHQEVDSRAGRTIWFGDVDRHRDGGSGRIEGEGSRADGLGRHGLTHHGHRVLIEDVV